MMDTHTSGMTYARFFPSDWRSGCFVLNLEEEGLYIRCCAYMYDTGRSIPADNHEAARLLNVQYNKYCKVMGSLVDKGKMIRGQGWIINERVQEELHKFRMEKFARSQAAKAREEARKKQAQLRAEFEKRKSENETVPPQHTPHHTPHQTGGVSPGVTPGVSPQAPTQYPPQKSNEIKDGATTAVAQSDHGSTTNPESRIQNPEKKESTTTVEQDAAGGSSRQFDELNGSAVDLVRFIAKYARVEPLEAERMLSTNIKAFGAPAMLEAYSFTDAEMRTSAVGQPYKYLIATARGCRDKAARATAKEKQPAESRKDRLLRHVEQAASAKEAR